MKRNKFLRQNATHLKRIGKKWRKPKGNQSKMRMEKIGRGALPRPGYGSPKATRGLHPCGLKEVLIFTVGDLEKVDGKKCVCRISSTVGRKKRIDIVSKAKDLKIRILNPSRSEKLKKKEVKKEEKPKEKPKQEPKKEAKKEEKKEGS